MRTRWISLCPILALLAAGQALAQQPQADQAESAQAKDKTAGAQPTGPNVSPPVTVIGKDIKPCSPRDQKCVHDVSLELWKRYPAQIEALCARTTMHAIQTGFLQMQMGYSTNPGDGSGPTGLANHLTPQTQELCQFRTMHRKELAASAETAPATTTPAAP